MTDPGPERWLTPGVKGIGGASLLADLGHEIPTSLLPSLLTSTLGAPAAALGLIEGIADGAAGAARFAGGVLADDPEVAHNPRQATPKHPLTPRGGCRFAGLN
jgi:hypothetical protein